MARGHGATTAIATAQQSACAGRRIWGIVGAGPWGVASFAEAGSRHTLFLSQAPHEEAGTAMTATRVGYGRALGWVKTLLGDTHATGMAVARTAALSEFLALRVAPAAMARALPEAEAG